MKNFVLPKAPRILLSRVDNIGDVILTLPMVAMLKQHFPEAYIIFLARDYVRAILQAYPLVDEFLSWDSLESLPNEQAVQRLKQSHCDLVIHVFPKLKIAQLTAKAGISLRLGTCRRWYHYFYCNQRVEVSRRYSECHEAQLNLQLLKPLGISIPDSLDSLRGLNALQPKLIQLPQNMVSLFKDKRFKLILHPFSHGHAKEWPLSSYKALIETLPSDQYVIFVTGSAQEMQAMTSLRQECPQAHFLCGQLTLEQFLAVMAHADGLIASSTGPLHMAAALGMKALGLFPPPQGINPQRWQPIGAQAEYLVTFSSECVKTCLHPQGRTCACLEALSVAQVKSVLQRWITS